MTKFAYRQERVYFTVFLLFLFISFLLEYLTIVFIEPAASEDKPKSITNIMRRFKEGRSWESGPLEIHKAIGFLRNTGLDRLENHKPSVK